MRFLLPTLGIVALAAPARAQDAPVATTDRFVFYSRLPLNLNDAIQRTVLGQSGIDSACLVSRPAAEREGWNTAVATYGPILKSERGMPIAVRFHLAGIAERVRGGVDPIPAPIQHALDGAAPAYRACQWAADDAANRAWIARLIGRLTEMGDEVAERLAAAYQTSWRVGPLPVDVVGYVSRQGANTVRPPHILINSSSEHHDADAALEAIFHEASHTIIGPRDGATTILLRATAERLGVAVPRDLWHVILFYTTGDVVRRVIEERTGREYQQYLYATGLFQRGWGELQASVEQWWPPYLRGDVSMEEAVTGILETLNPG